MEKYRYDNRELTLIENCCIPFAIYQFLNNRVVTIALSDGLLETFGYDDREEARNLMDHNMYRDTYPDDVARIENAAIRFATQDESYNVLYRTLIRGEYHLIHSWGKHIHKEGGIRLAVVWYADEGVHDQEGMTPLDRELMEEISSSGNNLVESYDTMTGLPGMDHFFTLAEDERISLLEQGESPALLYFDFNGMKNYNLRYGFAEGDRLIIAMSRVLVSHFSADSCGRVTGDRFVVCTKERGLEEELHAIFSECKSFNEGRSLPVRVGIYLNSMGFVRVGTACDRAKMACDIGRNNPASGFNYFTKDLLEETERRQYIIEHLDEAIRENWIRVYYQPLVRAANGRVCDEEALARWIDPERGILSPADFIPVLEDAGLIYKLDLYVLDQILIKMNKLRAAGFFVVPSSLNVSRVDFEVCDIVEEIRKRVDEAGIGREMLTIEITESVIGNDIDYIRRQVDRFHKLGFRVWMDDYGSGYSSPDILQSIPFDTIKLDMQFIRQYEKNRASRIIISGLIRIAMGLSVETVVEGVETREQAEFLKEVGCTKLQGFYYCRPIPLEEILNRYENGSQIGFENPDESAYYSAIGKVNLYDLTLAAEEEQFQDYFNTMPMAILQLREEELCVTRCNQSYRTIVRKYDTVPKVGVWEKNQKLLSCTIAPLMRAVMQCAEEGGQLLVDHWTQDDQLLHLLVRRIAVDPIIDERAVQVILLGYVDNSAKGDAHEALRATVVRRIE